MKLLMNEYEHTFVKKKHLTPVFLSCMIAQVVFMESLVRQSMLYDFYGELLTEHQRHVYEDVVFHDLSLSEIAQEQGISRQGVHDLIKRCDRILTGYEEKLHLISKFETTRRMVEEIHRKTKQFKETRDEALIGEIEQISSDIIEL